MPTYGLILGFLLLCVSVVFLLYALRGFHLASRSRENKLPNDQASYRIPVRKRLREKRKILIFAGLGVLSPIALCAQNAATAQSSNEELENKIDKLSTLVMQLESRIEQLEGKKQFDPATAGETAAALRTAVSGLAPTAAAPTLSPDDRSVLDFFHGTTLNFGFDGYYEYNFNQPIGRVNLLRAYDVSSNSFSLNQANIIIEHAPDPAAGKRFGGRIDLQYGQATETVQGGAQNELRPQVYRNLWQAYGTYVAPVGSGLTIDFGKWGGALGVEGNYTKDQINYSRAYFFNYLPFYHMGFRATYSFNDKLTVSGWLVNGVQQVEDFNGFKTVAGIVTYKPIKSISWNLNYCTGQEQRDVVANYSTGLPSGPTQPGLPTANISPVPNGRQHILDSYATWNVNSKLTLVGEGDYVINRVYDYSAPAHVSGGAAYARYQLTPKWALAARAEYLSDRGGLFSGVTQALKETTTTAEYKLGDGFLVRAEWRRDFSNVPFFLTDKAGVLKKDQNTSALGMVWWFGMKQGSW